VQTKLSHEYTLYLLALFNIFLREGRSVAQSKDNNGYKLQLLLSGLALSF